jgi:DNA-binding GntR family transcriptional regulator
MLNKNDVIPLYVQLKRLLKKDILSGKYKENDILPSETQLMKKFDITRTTIRKAINELKIEGLVTTKHGKGTVVKIKETKDTVWNFKSFTEIAKNQNLEPISKVIEQKIITENNQKYNELSRLRGVKHRNGSIDWMTVEKSKVPTIFFPGIDQYNFENQSLYTVMAQNYHHPPYYARLEMQPIISDERIMEILELSSPTPLLKSSGKAYTESDEEIEHFEIIYSPSFKFVFSQYIE